MEKAKKSYTIKAFSSHLTPGETQRKTAARNLVAKNQIKSSPFFFVCFVLFVCFFLRYGTRKRSKKKRETARRSILL